MRIQDLEIENRHLRETINDYNREFKAVRNQEVTIKLLRKKVREFEDKEESIAQDKCEDKDPELFPLFDDKESDPSESRLSLTRSAPSQEADTKVAQLQSAFDRSQSETFDLKPKYDEDSSNANEWSYRSDEMEIIVNDLERANQRAALAEQEVNHLKDQLAAAKQSLQLADQIQKAPDMEQAVDVVARSALELELAAKEKEISQLVDDIQRLQAILKTLQETSASKIAQLEELVNEKDKMIVELGEKLVRQQDYEAIKKELSILKSADFSSSRPWESIDENKNQSDKPPDITKENRKNSENTPLKLIKSEDNGVSQNYSLQSVDNFGTMLGQEIVSNFSQNVAKEEICSRPSSPVSKGTTESYSSTSITSNNSPEDRKPSPPAPAESPSAVNLTSSERASPTTNNHNNPPRSPDNPSLGKLQDCLRHNIDKYANETLNTLNIARCVRELLSVHNIGQRLFAKFVLGLSQGTVSELLSKPKPWDKLTEKGRDSYRKMHAWASDDHCIGILKSLVPRRVAERRSTLLSSPPGKDCIGSSGAGSGGLSAYKTDDQGAEERIAQILNEAQMAMKQQQENKHSPSMPNGNSGDNRSTDSSDDIRENNELKSNHNSRDASHNDKSFRRSRKYENDDIPQEMVARIYQEELAKLIGQRVEEGFRTPRDQFERTQEEIRQALTIYHQELTRLSHLMPPNHHQNSFNPFTTNGSSYGLSHHHNSSNSAITNNNNNNTSSNISQSLQECPVDATVNNRTRSETKSGSSGRDEPEMRHHGSAFSLVRPKTESNHSSSINSKSSTTPAASSYNIHSSSPAPPALLPLSDSKTSSPGATQSGPDDLATSASPLQRMQSITNSLLSQSSLPSLPNPPQRPQKAVLPPITQQQFDQYNNVNTEDIVKKVKEQLSQYSISQRLFGESVLGLSQGSVSDLLARPKPWHMLTQKGREPFIRMKIFLEDENAVHKLVASQYKIAPEKLMRTGSFGGATNPQSIMTFGGSNKMSPRPIESNLRTPDSRQIVQNNALYSSHNQPRTPDTSLPMSLTVSPVTSTPPSTIHPRKVPNIGRGYNQPSVYEMAALTTDLDTQIITSKIKETLMAHNIGQKIFGEVVLGLSQGSVSELLSKPKPWHMLSIKGREPFIRMQMWLNDPHNVEMLQTLKNERREANKRRRTGDGPMDSPRSQSDGGPMYSPYNFAPPSPYPPAKKPRVLFTEEQKEALRLAFSLDPYPSTTTIEFLATELNLSVRTITNWFHNHRMRMKQHASPDDDHSRKSTDMSLPPPVREGMAFDPVQYRIMLTQRMADKCRDKGGPQFVNPFGGSMPYLYSPYRNCSPLSSSGDDVGTLDLSMSSQLRNSMNSKADTNGGSSTDDRSASEMNDDESNLSQDNPGDNSDRESDREDCDVPRRHSASPLRQQQTTAHSEQPSRPVVTGGGSSNRRKPAMPQWVDPGLELSPENTDDEDDLDDDDRLDDESATEQEEIINGVCVRQTEDFDLLLPSRVETVHVLPAPAPDDQRNNSSSKCHKSRSRTNTPEKTDNGVLTNGLVGDRDLPSSEQAKDRLLPVGCVSHDNSSTTATLKKPVFLEEQDDESWDDAEAKDRRKNIEKLQQRLEKEDAGDDWEF